MQTGNQLGITHTAGCQNKIDVHSSLIFYMFTLYIQSEQMKKMNLEKRLEQEEYILAGMRPSAKGYEAQREQIKNIKMEIEFLKIEECKRPVQNPDFKA